jgi:ribosome biogenesis GTPase
LAPYRQIGYPVLLASSRAEHGLDTLQNWLRGRTSLLAGQSGVGKSSLIKALLPDREIRIQAVSAATGHGAHTTSASTLYHLPDGGDLIDSPGVRSFELGEIGLSDLDRGFPELATYLGRCRFSDCRHDIEPDCALRDAVAQGTVHARRLESYRQLRTTLDAAHKLKT